MLDTNCTSKTDFRDSRNRRCLGLCSCESRRYKGKDRVARSMMIFTYIHYDLQSVLSNADELYGSSNSVGMDSTDAGK